MRNRMKLIAFLCAGVLLISGCSMNDNKDKQANNGTENATDTNPPQNDASNDSIDQMLNYLTSQGVNVNDMKTIDHMDFAAHEGKSFSYNGNTGYLYRLKSNDENMKALLDSAKKNGTVKVNLDGTEQDYSASVNGDYLFVYQKDADMSNLVSALAKYVPGAIPGSATTPGNENETTTRTDGAVPNTGGQPNNGTANTNSSNINAQNIPNPETQNENNKEPLD